jgi:hypothetical protein
MFHVFAAAATSKPHVKWHNRISRADTRTGLHYECPTSHVRDARQTWKEPTCTPTRVSRTASITLLRHTPAHSGTTQPRGSSSFLRCSWWNGMFRTHGCPGLPQWLCVNEGDESIHSTLQTPAEPGCVAPPARHTRPSCWPSFHDNGCGCSRVAHDGRQLLQLLEALDHDCHPRR